MTVITHPPTLINAYLISKLQDQWGYTLPIFPSTPTDIDALTVMFPDSDGLFAVYDRMFKMRRKPFPHIKNEQLLYYFYKMSSDPVKLIETTQMVQDLLDNEDESAEDVNNWIAENAVNGLVTIGSGANAQDFKPVRFHSFRVYQLEETADIIDFGTARTYAGNKIIIDYTYHKQD